MRETRSVLKETLEGGNWTEWHLSKIGTRKWRVIMMLDQPGVHLYQDVTGDKYRVIDAIGEFTKLRMALFAKPDSDAPAGVIRNSGSAVGQSTSGKSKLP